MKNLIFSFLLILVLISAGCIAESQTSPVANTRSITDASNQQSCVKIIGEQIDNTKFVMSIVTLQNDCGDIVEGKISYIAYEADGSVYRGFVPSVATPFTLTKSGSKTITTQLPENWFSETEKIAREQYNHGIVTSYDIKINIIQIGPTPTRASVVSKYSGETVQDGPTIKYDPFVYKGGW